MSCHAQESGLYRTSHREPVKVLREGEGGAEYYNFKK